MLLKPISSYWRSFQQSLFSNFAEELGPTTTKHIEVILAIDMAEIERFVAYQSAVPISPGRPAADRAALARSFLAKAVINIPTTKALIERLKIDATLRRICNFEGRLPCEATFSNAFAEFAKGGLAEKVHEAMILSHYEERIVGHVSRDATAIDAREKRGLSHTETEAKPDKKKRKAGRPKKGTPAPESTKRMDLQPTMTLTEMLSNLPKQCNLGAKKDSHGNRTYWIGYKLHIDCADGGIPLSCILSSASLHDCQVAIPLEKMTNQRVTSLYSVMDAGYDFAQIHAYIIAQEKVPIIDPNKNNKKNIPMCPATKNRYKERVTIERVNSELKDNFNARSVRVKGHSKVFSHLMFGIIALTAKQLIAVFA
jgi:transposase